MTNKELTLKELGITELNLSNPLMCGYLSKFIERNEIDFDVFLPSIGKNLQRPLVWTLLQKQALIMSVFKQRHGFNNGVSLIPPMSAIQHENEDGSKVYQIIDGKQRLSTLIEFYRGEFPIEWDGVDYYYEELSQQLQRDIDLFNVLIIIKYSFFDDPVSDQEKIDWFRMINFAGTPQDSEHLNNLLSNNTDQ